MTSSGNGRRLTGMSFIDHIKACNAADISHFRPFEVAGVPVGSVRTSFAMRLAAFPDVFSVRDDRVTLLEQFNTPAARTEAVARVVQRLGDAGVLPKPRGEDYAVVPRWGAPSLMRLDRRFVSAFGVRAFGVHMNGIVRQGADIKLWIGRRAADKSVEPNKLDNIVAGGQPAGLTLAENLIKESAEEADIPKALVQTARPVGAITYRMEGELGLKPDTLFVYDLELPADFVPRNTDGEIASFSLMSIDEVAERVRATRDFKFNVNLVIIDFLIRHGRLTPDTEPDYMKLVTGLRTIF